MTNTCANTSVMSPALNARALIEQRTSILWLTFDTLRFDVAERAMQQGQTPLLQQLLPNGQWQKRHTPATFTYAAHHAFFSGYLPTPIPKPADYQRLFACEFAGSSTTGEHTWCCPAATLPEGLAQLGYHTECIGGVGFFNLQNPLGRVLPGLFQQQHWRPELGVTDDQSTRHQVQQACASIAALDAQTPLLMFINLSAMHQPNCGYIDGQQQDDVHSQQAALAYVDSQLGPLIQALQQRGDTLCLFSSDHGTAYGEDDQSGHGIAHPCIWEVPYAEFVLPAAAGAAMKIMNERPD
ncbi:STM4013/SEN3800 family hydrolase [Oceanobacter mangrovi]|uniref:STM4013/SEN3800 family hydrolase n=1 Tax=Oceanobacter mangrovi TaxID=2862510 RepID=UPI001C8F1352|nr:STM4013/SEN3800 family hydrolase [Oceanobacter mangrovi]